MERQTILLFLGGFIVLLFGISQVAADTATGQASITNAAPTFGTTTLYNVAEADAAITLTAASDTNVILCNSTVTDNNGAANVSSANATFFHSTSTFDASSDKNVRYVNTSCTFGTNTSLVAKPVECKIALEHEALSGTWTCNITVADGVTTVADTDTNTLSSLVALEIPDTTIDFAALALGANSTVPVNLTVINDGNTIIDARYSGSTYSCDTGTIPVGNTRYNKSALSYDGMITALTTSAVTEGNFNLGVEGNATADDTNSTQKSNFALLVPTTGVGGACSNTLTITAIAG